MAFKLRSILTLLLLTMLAPAGVKAQAGEWSQWRGPNRDGHVAGAKLPATWPETLAERWKVVVGVGHASPVIADGKIYVFARQGDEEVLVCLDGDTGKQLWRSANAVAYEMHPAATGHGKGPKATPIVSGGTVYTFGISGVLSAHDARTGELKWRREFSGNFPKTSPLYGTAMSPIVESGLVIAHVGGHDKGALMAFSSSNGAIRWANSTDGPAYASPVVATLAGVRQLVTFMQKDLVGVDLTNGKLLWRIPAKSGYDTNSVTPVIYKDMVIAAREDQGLTAFRIVKQGSELTPQEVWSNKQTELYMNTPVLAGNQLVGFSVRNKGQFFAIDAETGKAIWEGPGRAGENAAIIDLDGKVFLLLTNDANLFIQPVGAKQFAPLKQYSVASSSTWAHPLIVGNRIFVKDETTLRALSF